MEEDLESNLCVMTCEQFKNKEEEKNEDHYLFKKGDGRVKNDITVIDCARS